MYLIKEVIINKKANINPVWIMRQAGRYLPEFREIRKINTDFIKLCLNSELSTEFAARSDAVIVASNSPALVTLESSSMFARKSASLLVLVAILFYIYPVSGRYRTTIFEPAGGAPPTRVNVVVDIV